MKLSQTILPEFDQEMKTTRRVLERVADEHTGRKPHDKSMSFGRLATHIAELAGWGPTILGQDSLDLAPPGGGGYKGLELGTGREIVELFDAGVQKTRAAIEAAEDQDLMQPWTLLKGGQVVFKLPRIAVLRTMLFNHIIHHRGQLSVYLRLHDIPVPSIYGPSADEAAF